MSATDSDEPPVLTPADIYRAAGEGVLGQEDAARLVSWCYARQARESSPADDDVPRQSKSSRGLSRETFAGYAGAMLMIGATAWLLGARWEELSSPTVLALGSLYAMIVARRGRRLRERGHSLSGGLLITVAVAQVPLVTYALQDIFNFWPGGQAPQPYMFFHFMAHPAWVVMEVATIIVALLALRRVRFTFLGAPLGFACWLLARDLPLWATGYPDVDLKTYFWLSAAVGVCTLLVGRRLDSRANKSQTSSFSFARVEDLAFWPYLFGTLALWSALSVLTGLAMLHISVFALVSLGLIMIGLRERRKTFLVFGALGLDQSLRYLAHLSFPHSFFFPFVLVALGACLVLAPLRAERKAQTHN